MRRRMSCPYLADVRARWDRELAEAPEAELQAHLASCAICQEESAQPGRQFGIHRALAAGIVFDGLMNIHDHQAIGVYQRRDLEGDTDLELLDGSVAAERCATIVTAGRVRT